MKVIAVITALLLTVVILIGAGSAWYSAFIAGGLLWRATVVQLFIEHIPYLFAIMLIAGIWTGVLSYLKSKKS